MEIEGTIVLDLPKEGGVSKAGNNWQKKSWVLETSGQYPRKVKFDVFGDRADTMKFEIGKSYIVSVDPESREFNGRWYTDLRAYAMRLSDAPDQFAPVQQSSQFAQPVAPAAPAAAPVDPFSGADNNTDDLPF